MRVRARSDSADWDGVNVETETTTAPAEIPARGLPSGELNRATDVLLDAATDRCDPARAAATAAVAELADWCAVDLLAGDGLRRAASATAADLDRDGLEPGLRQFETPDPAMVSRLELAGAPFRVEDPDWLPGHRAVAAAIDGAGSMRGAIVALIPLGARDLAGDLWFMSEFGRRLAQVLELSPWPAELGGIVVVEPGGVNGDSREARLRRAT